MKTESDVINDYKVNEAADSQRNVVVSLALMAAIKQT